MAFSTSAEDIGFIRQFQFGIPWKKEENEVYIKPRPVQPAYKQQAREIIKQWVRMGVIEEASSPHNSPLFFIKKSKGGGIRPVIDCRAINEESVNMRYPIPHLQDLIYDVSEMIGTHGKEGLFISSTDIQAAYNQLRLAPGDKHKAAFSFENRQFTPLRTMFGLKNAPSGFCQFMAKLTLGLTGTYVLLDDVLILSTSFEDHLQKLSAFFDRVIEAGLTLKPSKTFIAMENVDYLGFKLSKDGIEPLEDKVKPILDYPTPKTKRDTRRFCGMTNFYSKFVKRGRQVLSPLYRLCGGEPFRWRPEHQEAFNQYKELLANYVRLAHRDTSKKLIVVTDGSNEGVSGALHQRHEDGSLEPLGFVSRGLTASEKRLASRYIELIAIVWTLKEFDWELAGQEVTVMSDHFSLQQVMKEREIKQHQPVKIQNAMAELSRYELTIIHKSNKDPAIVALDAFSRAIPMKPEDDTEDHKQRLVDRGVSNHVDIKLDSTDSQNETIRLAPKRISKAETTVTEHVNVVEEEPRTAEESAEETAPEPINLRRFARKAEDDPALVIAEMEYSYAQICEMQENDNDIKRKIEKGVCKKNDEGVYIENGVRWQHPVWLIPSKLAHGLASYLHVKLAHPGAERLMEMMKRKFLIKGLQKVCLEVCKNCVTCVITKPKPALKHPKPPAPDFVTQPWTRCFSDLCDFGKHDVYGNRYFLGVEDGFSRFLDGMPLADKKCETVAHAMANILLRNNATHCHLILDNGLEYAGPEVKRLLETLGITTSHISPYMANGNKIERLWREVGIKAKIAELDDMTWSKDAFVLLYQVNNLPNSAIGNLTPYEVLTGRPFQFPCFPSPKEYEGDVSQFEWVAYLSRWLYDIGTNMTNQNKLNLEQPERPVKFGKEFKIGDRVAFWTPQRVGESKKLYRGFDNDGKITKNIGNGSYEIRQETTQKKWIRNIKFLRLLPQPQE